MYLAILQHLYSSYSFKDGMKYSQNTMYIFKTSLLFCYPGRQVRSQKDKKYIYT